MQDRNLVERMCTDADTTRLSTPARRRGVSGEFIRWPERKRD
jgi:hypothetical protein